MQLAPGDAAQALTGGRRISIEALEAIREKYHLNDPLIVQYFTWLGQVIQGDLGQSIHSCQDVATAIVRKLGWTLGLTGYSTALVLLLGVPLGTFAALRKGSAYNRVIVVGTVIGVSTPAFVTGLILLYYFGFVLGLFPVFGPGQWFSDRAWHLTPPAMALGISVIAILVKVSRAAMIEEFDKDYVDFARARGLSQRRIVYGYVLRNALIPVITTASIIFVALAAGTIFIEVTFALPGMGTLLINAVRQRDIPLIRGATLFCSVFVIAINIATDVIYPLVDPRVHYGKSAE